MFRRISWDVIAIVAVFVSFMAPLGLYCVGRVHAFVGQYREVQAVQAVLDMGGSIRRLESRSGEGAYYEITFAKNDLAARFGNEEAVLLATRLGSLGKVHLDLAGTGVDRTGVIRLLETGQILEIDLDVEPVALGKYDDLKKRFPKTKINAQFHGCILIPPPS